MKCKGNFIFKGLKKKDGGKFINQTGQEISYGERYEVKFDEIDDNNEANERKINVKPEEVELLGKLSQYKMYKPIIMEFDVGFNSRGITLKLIDVAEPAQK